MATNGRGRCTRVLPADNDHHSLGQAARGSRATATAGRECPRFDADCESFTSIGGRPTDPRAPQAGSWWDYQARELARHANLQLDAPGALDAQYGWSDADERRFSERPISMTEHASLAAISPPAAPPPHAPGVGHHHEPPPITPPPATSAETVTPADGDTTSQPATSPLAAVALQPPPPPPPMPPPPPTPRLPPPTPAATIDDSAGKLHHYSVLLSAALPRPPPPPPPHPLPPVPARPAAPSGLATIDPNTAIFIGLGVSVAVAAALAACIGARLGALAAFIRRRRGFRKAQREEEGVEHVMGVGAADSVEF